MKLLRVYLTECGPVLGRLDRTSWPPEAASLADRLVRASRLKGIAPKAGRVELGVAVPSEGPPTWTSAEVSAAVGGVGAGFEDQAAEVLALRRHFGWEVALVLVPSDATPVQRLAEVAAGLAPRAAELAVPPAVALPTGGTNAPAWVVISGEIPSALRTPVPGPGLRVTASRLEWTEDGTVFREWALAGGEAGRLRPSGRERERERESGCGPNPGFPGGRVREAIRAWIRPGDHGIWRSGEPRGRASSGLATGRRHGSLRGLSRAARRRVPASNPIMNATRILP